MEVNQDATIKEILIAAQQQDMMVNILMSNGKSYKGTIVKIGTYHVRLELKDQQSFYDALISIDHISSIEVQVRT